VTARRLIFRQFVDEGLGCGSYLIGDAAAGEGVVVDPAFAIEPYLRAADAEGLRIVRVLETHTHADHLSGHGRFALEHGLRVSIHPEARPEYPFDPLDDGQLIDVGGVELRVLHTPGHRPEHCAFAVDGLVLTGDSLFVGGAARPDLAIEARAGAAALWHSVRRLAGLPNETVVYPGHVSGSLCGSKMSDDHSTSIGREKQTNTSLTAGEEDFVEESASLTTPRPPTTERLVALNRGPWVPARPPLPLLEQPGDDLVVDARPVDVFAAGHLHGSLSVALDGGSFASRAAFVLEPDEPFIVLVQSHSEAQEAARQLWAVGLFDVRGYVLEGDGDTLATMTVPELARLLAEDDPQVLDVREDDERESTPLPGASALPFRLLRTSPPAELERGRPIYTVCASGARATLAASLLARHGFDARPVLGGGAAELVAS
jgi:hydroxyacylglutathione hydrolase